MALALIKTEGLDDAGRIRVRREAQAMGQLGDHPHVVTVHDIGEEDGRIYIVDANKTDMGPPAAMKSHDKLAAMRSLADAFAAMVDERLANQA